MSSSTTPTAYSVSPDSGEHWTAEGAWPVAEGIHRIPLPLPMDGLRAVNVYVLTTDDGLVLVDGGWAIPAAREILERSLASIGAGVGDIRRFLVTHVHRDHYTMARVLGTELGIDVTLGRGDQPGLAAIQELGPNVDDPFAGVLRGAGDAELAELWSRRRTELERPDPVHWTYPDSWLDGDHPIRVGDRTLDAVHTPGHTPGHYVFADRAAGLLLAGDHVLPTITPSIGFTVPVPEHPLRDFMASLTKVRGLPDLKVLPAHGPVAPSTHARVDELLAHHETRLAHCLEALVGAAPGAGQTSRGQISRGQISRGQISEGLTSHDVAGHLPWTRHQHAYASLDEFNRGLAVLETKAHLELLVARGTATRAVDADGVVVFRASTDVSGAHD